MVVDEARDGRALAGRPEAFFLDVLRTFARLDGRLDRVTVSRRTLTTSRLCVHSRRMVDHGLVLVGDAAGYFDPFTGEGIYQALRTAELAAAVIESALSASDLSAAALAPYGAQVRHMLRGKRAVEAIVQSAVQAPWLMDRITHALSRRKWMADTIVAVTGDYLPPSAVLNPVYIARLLT
jgi:flavin-dependent dehydrogenase